jgi:hypothetical protein
MAVKTRRRTETTVEAHEVWVVRGAGRAFAERCHECAGRAVMLTPEDAATLTGITPRTLYRWVEAGRVHFREAADGSLLICLASLPAGEPPAAG